MEGPTRSDRRRAAIIQAASQAFLAHGFPGTSVDEIAAAAGASKRTVYSHFGGKEGLFRALIRGTVDPMQAELQRRLDEAPTEPTEQAVEALTLLLARLIVTPTTIALRRLLIAEADRFPDLAEEWYRVGPAQALQRLEGYVTRLVQQGAVRVPSARQAAEVLLWLSISTPLNRLIFAPSGTAPEPGELERAAAGAADVFWRSYRSG